MNIFGRDQGEPFDLDLEPGQQNRERLPRLAAVRTSSSGQRSTSHAQMVCMVRSDFLAETNSPALVRDGCEQTGGKRCRDCAGSYHKAVLLFFEPMRCCVSKDINSVNLVVMSTRPKSAKGLDDTFEQLRGEIRQLQNVTAQQAMVASKLVEAYTIAEQMLGKLFEILERIIELETNHIDRKSTQRHTNDAA
jgi:hypothetical protein